MNLNKFLRAALSVIVCSAVGAVLMIIGGAVPALMLPSIFLCSVVYIYNVGKTDGNCGFFNMLITSLLLFGASWLFEAQAEGFSLLAAVYVGAVLPSFVFGLMLKRNTDFENKYFASLATMLISVILALVFVKAEGFSVSDAITDAAQGYRETLTAVLEQSGIGATQNIKSVVADITDQTVQALTTYLPAIIIIFSMIWTYLTVMAGVFVLRKLKLYNIGYAKFNMIHVPQFVCLITSVLFIVIFMSESGGMFAAALGNIAAVSEFLIGISGAATVDYFFAKKIASGYVRALIYLCAFGAGFLFASLMWEVMIVIGFVDSLWNIRFRDGIRGE